MNIRMIASRVLVGAIVLAPSATAWTQEVSPEQAPGGATPPADLRDLGLTGNRFAPLAYAELTPDQRTLVDNVLSGPRRSLGGPFNVLLRAPELGDRAQALGAYVRFESSLPAKLREMAITMTAQYWAAEFEWYAHKRAALAAGLDPALVEAIEKGRRPRAMAADEAALYALCRELLDAHRVSEATFAAAVAELGERGVVDVVGTVGYYSLVSMLLNVDEYPLPEGVEPAFR